MNCWRKDSPLTTPLLWRRQASFRPLLSFFSLHRLTKHCLRRLLPPPPPPLHVSNFSLAKLLLTSNSSSSRSTLTHQLDMPHLQHPQLSRPSHPLNSLLFSLSNINKTGATRPRFSSSSSSNNSTLRSSASLPQCLRFIRESQEVLSCFQMTPNRGK